METLHPREIDLGLERVRTVCQRLALDQPGFAIITVAGTNGKGSTVAMLEAILHAAGYRVGSYTSPHLVDYNERVRIQTCPVTDEDLCGAFARVDAQRAGTPWRQSICFAHITWKSPCWRSDSAGAWMRSMSGMRTFQS